MLQFLDVLMWMCIVICIICAPIIFIRPLGHRLFGWHYVGSNISPTSRGVKETNRYNVFRTRCKYCGKLIESTWSYGTDGWGEWHEVDETKEG